jgi:hypothetical protein
LEPDGRVTLLMTTPEGSSELGSSATPSLFGAVRRGNGLVLMSFLDLEAS